ncbi:MAG: AP2 domain-containing protein [Planctomycetota bacterium]
MSANLNIKIPDWLDKICASPLMWYRRRKYGYDFRRIYLGDGEWTILDKEDYYRLNHYKWFLTGRLHKFYAARTIKDGGRTIITRMHRDIMNPPPKLLVDHRNCDGLDNRRENLRLATKSQNAYNSRKRNNTSSRYIGVHLRKNNGRWEAQIRHHEKRMWLGSFKNEIDAARAYDEAAKKYHGKFARLNFPEENRDHN